MGHGKQGIRQLAIHTTIVVALVLGVANVNPAHAAQFVAGKASTTPKALATMGSWRNPSHPDAAIRKIVLAPLPAGQLVSAVNAGDDDKRTRIGIARDVAFETRTTGGPAVLAWVPSPGGMTARITIASPGAAALRAGISVRGLPANAELRVAGSKGLLPAVPAEAIEAAMKLSGVFWSPLTEGDTLAAELWLPAGSDTSAVRVAIATVSHLGVSPATGFKASSGPGAAQGCHLDVVCTAATNDVLARIARSVAKMVFTENGATFLCSATLLNDGVGSEVPYLYTAAHCIGSQATAASVNTFWFYESSACNSATARDYTQLAAGSTLLHADTTTDVALLRLRERAPSGAWFAGWDARALDASAAIIGIHHPAGDLKKLSIGLAQATSSPTYTTIAWTVGSTEGGSSGSGLFTLSGSEYLLRGALRGGSASCTASGHVEDPSNRDYYSRIDLAMPLLKAWLDGAVGPMEDYAGLWWNPAEPGSGVSIAQGAGTALFATWYTYDANGSPTWIVVSEGRWTSTSTFEGNAYRTTGSGYDKAYRADAFRQSVAGSVQLTFTDADHATFTAVIDGRTIVTPLARFAL